MPLPPEICKISCSCGCYNLEQKKKTKGSLVRWGPVLPTASLLRSGLLSVKKLFRAWELHFLTVWYWHIQTLRNISSFQLMHLSMVWGLFCYIWERECETYCIYEQVTHNQANYPSHRLQFLALKCAVCDKFSHWLKGHKFPVWSKNNPLTCEQCWVSKLTQFAFDIKHIPGHLNMVADALSGDLFVKPLR